MCFWGVCVCACVFFVFKWENLVRINVKVRGKFEVIFSDLKICFVIMVYVF